MFGKKIRENGLEKMETIILKCNLFRIYWRGVWHLFTLIPHLYIHELPTKYQRE